VVFEEQAQGIPYGLVSAVVYSPVNELVQELHVPLGQPDGDPLPLALVRHVSTRSERFYMRKSYLLGRQIDAKCQPLFEGDSLFARSHGNCNNVFNACNVWFSLATVYLARKRVSR